MGGFCPLPAVPLEQANRNVVGLISHLLWTNTVENDGFYTVFKFTNKMTKCYLKASERLNHNL